jgi:anti-sigma factor RsiW
MEILLQDYLDGYLLESQREMLEAHVRRCDSCRTLLGEMKALDEELVDFPQVEDPDGLSRRILEAIPKGEKRYAPRWRSTSPVAGMLLAAMAVVVVGFFFGSRYGTRSGEVLREVEIVFHAPGVRSVAVVGDFNEWDPERHAMKPSRDGGTWRLRLKLAPGVYEYGFLIDGSDWSKDPLAERFLADGFGGENSILFVEG